MAVARRCTVDSRVWRIGRRWRCSRTATVRVSSATGGVVFSFSCSLGMKPSLARPSRRPCNSTAALRVLGISVLNHAQTKDVLRSIPTTDATGWRDRAMLEMLYSTGIRAAELLGLNIADVDFTSETARVFGKGQKERLVPIGKTALRLLESYLRGASRSWCATRRNRPCSSIAGASGCPITRCFARFTSMPGA